MNSSFYIYTLLLILAAVYLIFVYPRREEKKRAAKEAAKISQLFGNWTPTLYVFGGKDEKGVEDIAYALVFGQDIYAPQHFYEIGRIWGDARTGKVSDKERQKKETQIRYMLSLLPFSVSWSRENISWSSYSYKKAVRSEADEINKLKGGPFVCYSVESEERPGWLTYIVWSKGTPFKYGTDYKIIRYDEYNASSGDEVAYITDVLHASDIKDKTIHATGSSWEEAFAHFADGVTAI